MSKKRIIVILSIGILAALPWVVYSKVAHARREATYVKILESYKRDLRIGMTREEVRQYLSSRNVAYSVGQWGSQDIWNYEVKIGEEPDGIACEPWIIYVAMEFNSTDNLSKIHLRRVGTCL